jgi:tRNA nucleotidyltransferase (CCA-adding enzyme)
LLHYEDNRRPRQHGPGLHRFHHPGQVYLSRSRAGPKPLGPPGPPGARIHEGFYGSNTTGLGLELIQKGIFIEPEDATIALTGIYADTGNFTHANVKREDFEVAAFLLAQGASLKLVKDFLVPLKEKQQVVLFHEILNLLGKRSIRGHLVQICYLELDDDAQGAGRGDRTGV